jgi:hypothetical protein
MPEPIQPLRWARFGAVELDLKAGELHASVCAS